MSLYVQSAGSNQNLSGLYTMGSLGRRKMSRKQKQLATFAAGAFTYGAVTKWIAPGVQNLLVNWKAKRKAARTQADIDEANRIKKLLMKSSPELFEQQPGMPPPVEIRRAVEAAEAGQPVKVITKVPIAIPERRAVMPAPRGMEPVRRVLVPPSVIVKEEKEKTTIEKYLPWGGAALIALKILKFI